MINAVIAIALLLSGCTLHGRITHDDAIDTYSRADIDAINARTQCRNMARTLVQISRCDVTR